MGALKKNRGSQKELVLAGDDDEMLWWRWDGACDAVWYVFIYVCMHVCVCVCMCVYNESCITSYHGNDDDMMW